MNPLLYPFVGILAMVAFVVGIFVASGEGSGA